MPYRISKSVQVISIWDVSYRITEPVYNVNYTQDQVPNQIKAWIKIDQQNQYLLVTSSIESFDLNI